ncbi:MAG: glycosyltransferase family 2 protein [Acidobacteria bacterium]|nr:glycosyltransferase family 2 protein [Acidobacteriota bacterium]
MTNASRVSVVVPSRNEATHITSLLDAIRQQTYGASEILIVDSSSDGTADVVAAYCRDHPDLTLRVVPVVKASIPAAVNAGVGRATGDVIVRLDGHCIPDPKYIALAVSALEERVEAGVVGGVWQVAPGADTLVAEAIARAGSHPAGAGDAAYRIAHATTARQEVDTVPFGCYRKTLWTELGGLNEDLLTNEDYEFNYRVRASGRRVILDPAIRSRYFARATFGALARQYFRYGWWKVAMLRQHPASLRWRQAVPAAFVAALIGLSLLAAVSQVARMGLAGLLAIYVAVLALAGADAARKAGKWRLLPSLMAAFATIHLCWGSGAVVNLATGGRWPWSARTSLLSGPG